MLDLEPIKHNMKLALAVSALLQATSIAAQYIQETIETDDTLSCKPKCNSSSKKPLYNGDMILIQLPSLHLDTEMQ